MTSPATGLAPKRAPALLRWPWALGDPSAVSQLGEAKGSVDFTGTALIACPEGMRLLPVGGAADLALLANASDVELYELPQGRTGSTPADLEVRSYWRQASARWQIDLRGARNRFEAARDGTERESATSGIIIDWWEAFDELLSLGEAPDGAIRWAKVEDWLGAQKESSEPRRALIVEIAERLGSTIGERAQHLRRILLRKRDLVPVHRIAQLDEECLRWYIRQPGTTLAEKAGSKQEIMSVVRQETFDTLENRVLKDFLRRSLRAAQRYVRQFEENYSNSTRVHLVSRFGRDCQEALRQPHFEDVSRPRPGVQPNYVLQNDARYREIWRWYQKLLRNQDSEEQVWNWQSRLWSDVCRLLLATGLRITVDGADSDTNPTWAFEDASFFVHTEARLGRRLPADWAPGPIFLSSDAGEPPSVVSVVDAEQARFHPLVSSISHAGGHVYLIRERVEPQPAGADVLVVWAINSMASINDRDAHAVRASASAALQHLSRSGPRTIENSIRQLKGLILASPQQTGKPAVVASFPHSDFGVDLVELSAEPRGWQDSALVIAEWIEGWLR